MHVAGVLQHEPQLATVPHRPVGDAEGRALPVEILCDHPQSAAVNIDEAHLGVPGSRALVADVDGDGGAVR